MTNPYWWTLTDEESARLNPPPSYFTVGDDEAVYERCLFHPDWLSVGYIPQPRTRLGWFVYHLLHGLVMRYPLRKVIGFALANTRPGDEVDMTGVWDE